MEKVMAKIEKKISYYESGEVRAIFHLIGKIHHDMSTWYWRDGKISDQVLYINNRIEGEYLDDHHGKVLRFKILINDK